MAFPRSSTRLLLALAVVLSSLLVVPTAGRVAPADAAVPTGFREYIVFSGLNTPTAVEFAADGRVFVAERRGVIKVFDSVDDPTPRVLADLRTKVYAGWDRGLLGLTLHPDFPSNPSMYVLYTLDALPGGSSPHWGAAGLDIDPCPTPPGINADGCVVTGRLSKLTLSGANWNGSEQALVTDWCQQYPSHSIGSMVFGADGALYVSGGDGASFGAADYGQTGVPRNPCGDPPSPAGTALTPPTAEGGALRSQDVRSTGDPTGLDGTVIRIDPDTGAALPDNPLASRSDANARRIVAYGLRNPFRITVKPNTSELWIGDVGRSTWEEINRLPNPTAGPANYGWPCFEGTGRQVQYDPLNLNLCESLYSAGGVTNPTAAWRHKEPAFSGDTCDASGGSSTTGLAFYEGGSYPDHFDGALFHADYSRKCVWVMRAGGNGQPDPAQRSVFVSNAANPVELEVGPDGDLWYVDLNGTIRRIGFSAGNQPPVAAVDANPNAGNPPLEVAFDGRRSADPDAGDTLSYAWDLDGDNAFDDGTGATITHTYRDAGRVTARLRVTDSLGATDTASVTISLGTADPVPVIDTPSASTPLAVGQTVSFSGHATDPQEGELPASRLSWSADLHHCTEPGSCHVHPDIFERNGVASGTFTVPDHEYATQIELQLTATADDGAKVTTTRLLDLKTVQLNLVSSPPGVSLTVGATASPAPFTRSAHAGGAISVSAPSTVTYGGVAYDFASWSDGGAQNHDLTVPGTATTLTAAYRARTGLLFSDRFEDGNADGWTTQSGAFNVCRPNSGKFSPALCASSTATSVSRNGDPAWRDYSVEAAAYLTSASGKGTVQVLGRVTSSSKWYQLALGRDSKNVRRWFIQRRSGSAVTTLASGTFNYSAKKFYYLRLSMKGSTLTAHYSTSTGGTTWTKLGSVTDRTYTGGSIGVRSSASTAAFDNVRVNKL